MTTVLPPCRRRQLNGTAVASSGPQARSGSRHWPATCSGLAMLLPTRVLCAATVSSHPARLQFAASCPCLLHPLPAAPRASKTCAYLFRVEVLSLCRFCRWKFYGLKSPAFKPHADLCQLCFLHCL